ncbi:MAG: ThuA domain-containing protein [Planctomycetota bacterium]
MSSIPCTMIRTALMVVFLAVCAPPAPGQSGKEIERSITEAAPAEAFVKSKKPRKLLVFTLTRGFRHASIPVGARALEILGAKSGAFEVTRSDDISLLEPEAIEGFDAICLLNTTGELLLPPKMEELPEEEQAAARERGRRLRKSLLDFVSGGKGLIGIHAATDCLYGFPEFGRLIGGYFDGHPWHEVVTVKLDEPGHPVNAPFAGEAFEIKDEIYQFRAPYSRERQRVLLSLDTARTDMKKKGIHRDDDDFAVSWVRRHGKGRVFYCSLGHRDEIFWNPRVLRHYLAGIQYALGDLPCEDTPQSGP